MGSLSRGSDSYRKETVHDLFSLEGRVVVITGGGRGIGLAMAFAAVEAGADIAIIDAAEEPHSDFLILKAKPNVRAIYCRQVEAIA